MISFAELLAQFSVSMRAVAAFRSHVRSLRMTFASFLITCSRPTLLIGRRWLPLNFLKFVGRRSPLLSPF